MLGSKLIDMLQTLTIKEINKLAIFLASPIYNRNKKLIQLFEIIRKEHPTYEASHLQKEFLYAQLFPQKTTNDYVQLRYLMSQLTKVLEKYFIYIALEKKENTQHELLLDELGQRGLEQNFYKKINTILNSQQKQTNRSIDYLFYQLQFTQAYFTYTINFDNRKMNVGLPDLITSLDTYYIASALAYNILLLNRQNVLNQKPTDYFLQDLLPYIPASPIFELPVIQIYYYTYLLLSQPNIETHFTKVKELLYKHHQLFNDSEARLFYLTLANYCTKKVKNGQIDYLLFLFELYKKMLRESIIIVDNYLSPHHYKNITTAALRLKKYDWAENFIHEYQPKIHPSFQEGLFNYNLATLHFERKQYDKAHQCLLSLEFIDAFYHVSYKVLLIKNYYELSEDELLLSASEAFRIYLMRNKTISEYNRTAYKNFIKLVKKLQRVKEKQTKKSTAKLQDSIQNATQVIEKQWLIEKVSELS